MKFSMGQQLSQANLLEALISCFESILENGNLINTASDNDDAGGAQCIKGHKNSSHKSLQINIPTTPDPNLKSKLTHCNITRLKMLFSA